jgi:hypothetical protein
MRNPLSASKLGAGFPDLADDLELLHQGVVLLYVEDDSGALTVLGQDQRASRIADFLEEACGVRTER